MVIAIGKKKFYDTCALLAEVDNENLFSDRFYVSTITLHELENIKSSKTKEDYIKYKARKITHLLDKHFRDYDTVVYERNIENYITNELGLDSNIPDNKIVGTAKWIQNSQYIEHKEIIFITNDICLKNIARSIGLEVESVGDKEPDEYKGFIEKSLSEVEMAYFYEHINENMFKLLANQYLILKDNKDEVVDACRWNGTQHEPLFKKNIQSLYFDKLKSKDIYQSCAIDSLMNCTITAITGKPGSGKSLLALMSAMYLIEKGKYDRIVVLFNPTKTRGASDMGYYGGDFIDKAMQNSIGQILTTKFGDRYAVDLLLTQNKLKLVSMADCRGMEISDYEILWITESQNTSIDLIKLCLSRVSSGAKVFIEGDYLSQVDSNIFDGNNNGLKRIIDVFKGHEEFGYVQLQNVWRSKIAELCELL